MTQQRRSRRRRVRRVAALAVAGRAQRVAALAVSGAIALSMSACDRSTADRAAQADGATHRAELQMAQAVLREARWEDIGSASVERGLQVMLGTPACRESSSCFSCFQCHGYAGEGSPLARIPRLTGQSYQYLHRALEDFASGRRLNATMHIVANGLTPQAMQDVSAYFAAAAHAWPAGSLRSPPQSDLQREAAALGREIAMSGSQGGDVQACADCHGMEGTEPLTPLYPYLAGQHPGYVQQQLEAFRAGERRDVLNIMHHVAKQMTDEQIDAVAQYYGSIAPPLARRAPGVAAAAVDD